MAFIHFLFSIVTLFITERSISFDVSYGHFPLSRLECDVFIHIFETASELTSLCSPLNSGLPVCEFIGCVNFQDYGFLQVFKESMGLRIFFFFFLNTKGSELHIRGSETPGTICKYFGVLPSHTHFACIVTMETWSQFSM